MPTRLQNAATATQLRADGLLLREIAEQMGVATSTVHSWVSDPDGSKLRARKRGYAGTCERCGAPTNGYAGIGKAGRHCQTCNLQNSGDRQRAAYAPFRAMIEEMWAEGMTGRQIGEALGWSRYHMFSGISKLRERGYNLPYRRSASTRAKMAVGATERMAHARASRKRAA